MPPRPVIRVRLLSVRFPPRSTEKRRVRLLPAIVTLVSAMIVTSLVMTTVFVITRVGQFVSRTGMPISTAFWKSEYCGQSVFSSTLTVKVWAALWRPVAGSDAVTVIVYSPASVVAVGQLNTPWKTPLVVVAVLITDMVPLVIVAADVGLEVRSKVIRLVVLSVFVA